jgi:protein AbiQ
MDTLKIYHVKEEYIKYLRIFDNKVTIVKDEGKARPYVGIVFEINEYKYFAPFSSPEKDSNGEINEEYKKRYGKNSIVTYEKIEDLKYGTIKINNMIPIHESQLIYFKIDDIIDEKYRNILQDQFIYCDNNKERILNKANKLYKLVTIYKNAHFISVSCNFKLLEQKCLEYQQIIEVAEEAAQSKQQVAPTGEEIKK